MQLAGFCTPIIWEKIQTFSLQSNQYHNQKRDSIIKNNQSFLPYSGYGEIGDLANITPTHNRQATDKQSISTVLDSSSLPVGIGWLLASFLVTNNKYKRN